MIDPETLRGCAILLLSLDARAEEIARGAIVEITPETRATVGVEYIKNDQSGARLRGVPFLATGFATDISFNGAEPTDYQNLDTTVYSFQLDHTFSRQLRVNAYARYFQSDADQAYHETNTFNPTTGLWPREFRIQNRHMEEYSWAVNAVAETPVETVQVTEAAKPHEGGDAAEQQADNHQNDGDFNQRKTRLLTFHAFHFCSPCKDWLECAVITMMLLSWLAESEADDHAEGDKRRCQVIHIDLLDCFHGYLHFRQWNYLNR